MGQKRNSKKREKKKGAVSAKMGTQRVTVMAGNQNNSTPQNQAPPRGHFAVATEAKIDYLESIVEKQLNLYNWCEEKVSTLATLDSILLAVATLFIGKTTFFDPNVYTYGQIYNAAIVTVLILPLFISLAIALWHIRPKMGKASNTGRPNHRSSNGIRHFQDKAAYRNHLSSMTAEEICEDLTNQIYGMNNNIWKNQQSIKIAVYFDLVSLLGFFFVLIAINFI